MRKLLLLSIVGAILVSCGTSNSVVNNGMFQKRKYTSGWFLKKNKSVEKKAANEENLALEEVEKEFLKTEQSSTPEKKESVSSSKVVVKRKQATSNDDSSFDKKSRTKESSKRKSTQRIKSISKESQTADNSTIALEKFGHEEETHKKQNKNYDNSSSSSGDLELILLVLLAIILPPLAVYLVQDTSTMFVVDLILFLIGWSSFWFFSLGGLAALAAVVIALLVVFGVL